MRHPSSLPLTPPALIITITIAIAITRLAPALTSHQKPPLLQVPAQVQQQQGAVRKGGVQVQVSERMQQQQV